ncbi:FG-GAP-like repeat-containing protein [Streptomyces cavernae]|uniref:FG-GAP-like repeat-containing protein n=1 Tax=Streptomyces cavernae TaxID=2259034 RepID=UPI000FEB9C8D|nr:FG-GAP-like repeat-containing protein [Streptomyces cavernae]
MRIRSATTAAALLAAVGVPLTLTASSVEAATPAVPYDFNGDGYRDLAIGAPGATVAGQSKAGAVSVVYGGSAGADPAKYRLITQNTSGVPGGAEAGDAFGTAVASADLNTDGYADLVVGAPGEDVYGDTNDGTVVIVWGGAAGLSGARTLVNYNPSDMDRYGQAMTAGDFDGDGDDDVAVGGTGRFPLGIVEGPFAKSGDFTGGRGTSFFDTSYGVEYLSSGDVLGTGSDALIIHSRTKGTDDAVTAFADARISNFTDWLEFLPAGYVSSVADVNGDGHADIAIGNHRETSADPSGALGGAVALVYGAPEEAFTTSFTTRTLTQATSGVPGSAESGDRFGSGVALGDLNGDGYADLAAGASHESIGGAGGTGTVTVLYGRATGLTTAGAATLSQSTSGVPGTSEDGDHFGARVLLADTSKDSRADLAVTAPDENAGDGAVWTLRGTTSGPTTSGAKNFGPTTVGVSTTGSPTFGAALGS